MNNLEAGTAPATVSVDNTEMPLYGLLEAGYMGRPVEEEAQVRIPATFVKRSSKRCAAYHLAKS